ncbi:hypothetical protein GOBAR_DD21894 [Gossypium barbadense]|nr:hypothetical protein GOBAR_DD21894 [Gossypium barbadense]
MDVENSYFLAKFQSLEGFERVLCQGPWIVYGKYLTVQPWTTNFNTAQSYPTMVMAWIQFLSLSGHMYKQQILWKIGGLVGKVAKLDYNTDNRVRRRFARMVVYVNLEKVLISQVLVNGTLQRIEYKYLPAVCFLCGHYGHIKEICPKGENEHADLEEGFASGKG